MFAVPKGKIESGCANLYCMPHGRSERVEKEYEGCGWEGGEGPTRQERQTTIVFRRHLQQCEQIRDHFL